MASPLRKQRDALLKKQQGTQQPKAVLGDQPQSLHLLLNEMDNDLKRLKALTRTDDKITLKRDELVPKYRPSVEEYLKGDELFDNPLFSYMIVWMFDIDELETAIKWCDTAIEKGFDTPFKRDFATFCADQVLKWAERMSATGHAIEPYFSDVFAKVRDKWRINEQLTAKYFKFAGLFLLRDEDGKPLASAVGDIGQLEDAQKLLTEAENQYSKIGVTTYLDKIAQRIRALKDGVNL